MLDKFSSLPEIKNPKTDVEHNYLKNGFKNMRIRYEPTLKKR